LQNIPDTTDADRSDHRIGNYNYSPPGALFRLMSADQKQQRFGISP
jgi:catalase